MNITSCEVVLITKTIFLKKGKRKHAVCLGRWTSWVPICPLELEGLGTMGCVVAVSCSPRAVERPALFRMSRRIIWELKLAENTWWWPAVPDDALGSCRCGTPRPTLSSWTRKFMTFLRKKGKVAAFFFFYICYIWVLSYIDGIFMQSLVFLSQCI